MGLFVILFVAIILIAIAISKHERAKQEERRRQLGQLAERLGLIFHPYGIDGPAKGFLESLMSFGTEGPEDRLLDQFNGFDPFGRGHSQNIESLLAGSALGMDWLIFDYQYKITRSTGKSTSTTTYNVSVVAAELPLHLPRLTLGEESFLTRIGERLGIHDVHFESEEFNQKYRVHCQDRKLAFDLLHPQAIEFLLKLPVLDWQFGGPYILLNTSYWASPQEIEQLVEVIRSFVALIPEYVEQDRGLPPPPGGPLQGIIEGANG